MRTSIAGWLHTPFFRVRFAEHYERIFSHVHFFGRHAPTAPPSDDALHDLDTKARMPVAALLTSLDARESGLRPDEVTAKQATYGLNEVGHARRVPWWQALWLSYSSPFSWLLTVLGVISYVTDDQTGALVIAGMVALATAVRFIEERRSHEAAEALRALITPMCTVVRAVAPATPDTQHAQPAPMERLGASLEIPGRELVPGDIVLLSAGDIVPADVRLLKTKDVLVNQTMLTGESLPVEKHADAAPADSASPLDMLNLCFMGTTVLSGAAASVVIATGCATYFGMLAQHIGAVRRAPTQFQLGISKVSWLLLGFMAVMVPFVLFINGFTKGDWTEAVLFALSVAVGLTPEMLPMIVSSTLAKGAVQLSRKKVVVKRLDAIQDFGAMDVLCTDKTGTLTQGKISLTRHGDAFGLPDARVLAHAYLNSLFQAGLKNEMDIAILESGEQQHVPAQDGKWSKRDELPFDFVRRRMSVALTGGGQCLLVCKGALEEMLAVCTQVQRGDEVLALTPALLRTTQATAEQWNREGLRVVAVATRALAPQQEELRPEDEAGLTLLGYLAFLDPPKETSAAALSALRQNGITIKVLTGDNELVARKICDDVGLDVDQVLSGSALDAMDDNALVAAVEAGTLFSKLSPLHKERVVRALRASGHVVGFMGDGINDAPALHAADVGISVNTAVDVAKDAADLILLEKSLMVLGEGVMEGRKIFINMLKYIKMTASSNFGNVFSVMFASIVLPFLPMLPLHLLVQNLLYDISQTAIPFDYVDTELLSAPQRWSTPGLRRFMLVFGPLSSFFDILTFGVLWFVFAASTPATQTLFQSGWFVEGLLSQTLIVHMIRTQKIPFIQSRASWPLIATSAAVMAVGIWIPMGPLASSFRMQALPLAYFGWLTLILLSYIGLAQGVKGWYIRRYGWQ